MRSNAGWGLCFALALAGGAGCGGENELPPRGGGGDAGVPAVPAAGEAGSADGRGGSASNAGGSGAVENGGDAGAGGNAGASGAVEDGGAAEGGAAGAPGGLVPGDLSRDILDTTIEFNLSQDIATATITLAGSNSGAVSFEIGDLDIDSVSSDGEPLRFRDVGSVLNIEVPASSEPTRVTIHYAWYWHENLDGASAQGFTLTWPYYCGNLFPCHSDPSDGTRFHVHLSGVPAGPTIVYPTAIESDAPAYMFAWAIGEYSELTLGETSAGTSVSMWYKPGGKAAAAAGGAHLVAAFDWLEQRLGPYRFGARVGSVAMPWTGGGMEHHPFWHVAETSMSDEAVQMHEAAHGWFGDGVRLKCWEDLVLSEGTATYLAARMVEGVVGTTQSDSVWQGYQAELDGFRKPGANHQAWPQSCGVVDVLKGDVFSRSPYIKGAFFYRGVEQRVGREPLDQALRTFYERFAGHDAGMQEMLDVIAEVTGYDPAPCAESWLIDAASVPNPAACP